MYPALYLGCTVHVVICMPSDADLLSIHLCQSEMHLSVALHGSWEGLGREGKGATVAAGVPFSESKQMIEGFND